MNLKNNLVRSNRISSTAPVCLRVAVLATLVVSSPEAGAQELWPSWFPIPIGFADREDVDDYLRGWVEDAVTVDYQGNDLRLVEIEDDPFVFLEPIPLIQTDECSEDEYMQYGLDTAVSYTADEVTGEMVPVFCEPQQAELLEADLEAGPGGGFGMLGSMDWWTDEWNWTQGLLNTTSIEVKSSAAGASADDTEFCAGTCCLDVTMPVDGTPAFTAAALRFDPQHIIYFPSYSCWAEAGPDAWDNPRLVTSRSTSDPYTVDYVKFVLNDRTIQGYDLTDEVFPACEFGWCTHRYYYSEIHEYRLDLLGLLGADARDCDILTTAVQDTGQTAQSSESTEKYLIYHSGSADPANWCSEFASWAVREETSLEPPVANDPGIHIPNNLIIEDLWDWFEAEDYLYDDGSGSPYYRSRAIPYTQHVWDSSGEIIEPGYVVVQDNWSHTMLVVDWSQTFDPNADINYIQVIEGNGGWGRVNAIRTVTVCGPYADWANCRVRLCREGPGRPDTPGPNPPIWQGGSCDFFMSTQE